MLGGVWTLGRGGVGQLTLVDKHGTPLNRGCGGYATSLNGSGTSDTGI